MVASRHPSSRPAGAGAADRHGKLRPVSSRSQSGSTIGGCRDQRPQLRLVVDNTACGSGSANGARSGPMGRGGASGRVEVDPGSLATELGAWLKASARLADARLRLAHRRWINRHGNFGMTDRIGGLGPVVACVAVVVFGALVGVRLAQESSSGSPDALGDTAGSMAAVATSTSSAADSSDLAAPGAPGSAVVVVHPGDSLWSIAVSRYPEHDPRAVVDAFAEANGASMIRSGQQLIVPAALLEP